METGAHAISSGNVLGGALVGAGGLAITVNGFRLWKNADKYTKV